jgi:hypothetical protein
MLLSYETITIEKPQQIDIPQEVFLGMISYINDILDDETFPVLTRLSTAHESINSMDITNEYKLGLHCYTYLIAMTQKLLGSAEFELYRSIFTKHITQIDTLITEQSKDCDQEETECYYPFFKNSDYYSELAERYTEIEKQKLQ